MDWQRRAADVDLALEVAVAAEVLAEALSVDSGRFGHRSGALTVSALEPMRAIPHKVIVLMGLDDTDFPRLKQRPGFHLLEQQRLLGDPRSGDQDRYVLLEALMSARRHLLISCVAGTNTPGSCGRQPLRGGTVAERFEPPAWAGGELRIVCSAGSESAGPQQFPEVGWEWTAQLRPAPTQGATLA